MIGAVAAESAVNSVLRRGQAIEQGSKGLSPGAPDDETVSG